MKGAFAAIIAAFTSGIYAQDLYDAQAETIITKMVRLQLMFCESFLRNGLEFNIVMPLPER